MCGRFALRVPARIVASLFQVADVPDLLPHYNIAPTQPVAAVRAGAEAREWARLRWGLIPAWAEDPRIGNRMINARAETAAEKPAFRSAFRHRRCLIPADAFYEWQRAGTTKIPYLIALRDDRPFAFAGLWDSWQKTDGEVVESCALLTTEANDLVQPIHDRMPVILDPRAYDTWLDPQVDEPARLQPLLRPYPAEEMTAYAVSRWVNDPKHDDARCAEPGA